MKPAQTRSITFAHDPDESWTNLVFGYHGLWPRVWMPLLFWLICWYVVEFFEERFGRALNFYMDPIDKNKNKTQLICVFILCCYVTSIYQRWLNLYQAIPWPDNVCMTMHTAMPEDEKSDIKFTLMRYLMVSQAVAFMWVSPSFSETYPDLRSLMDISLLTEEEREDLSRCFVANDYEAAYWAPFLWFQNLVLAYFRNGAIDTEMSVEMIMNRSQNFLDGLTKFIVLADKQLPLGYTQLAVSIVWGNYFLTIFCSHKDVDVLPPFTSILANWILLGLLYISHEMLHPLSSTKTNSLPFISFDDEEKKSGEFSLTELFERNVRICQVMLECPLTDKGKKEQDLEREKEKQEKQLLFKQMEEQLRAAEEEKEKLALEKLEAIKEAERAEKELEDLNQSNLQASEGNALEIEKAKLAIEKAKQDAEKAKQELEKAHAEHLEAEKKHDEENKRLQEEMNQKLKEAKKSQNKEQKRTKTGKKFPNLLKKNAKRLPSEGFVYKARHDGYVYQAGKRR